MLQTSDIISPCSRLNDDVLREIFVHCIVHPGNAYTCYESYRRNMTKLSKRFIASAYHKPPIRELTQLNVSQVCSSWRDIALLTPQLWDNIYISYLDDANLSTAREYLSRAQNLPVGITIKRRAWTRRRPELRWKDWCSQLTDFLSSYRIRNLDLIVVTGETMPFSHPVLPDLPQRSVAELESLHICTSHHQEEIDLNDTRYPKLAFVRIEGTYKSPSFNCSFLRIFDGTFLSMTITKTWDLLSNCPSLEEAHLNVVISRMPVSMPQIQLPCLRILRLDSKSEITFSTFVEVLILPVVEELCLIYGWSTTAFQSLAHRSNYFPHLRDFSLIVPFTFDTSVLLALMPATTSISVP